MGEIGPRDLPVLITRTAPGAAQTGARLSALGYVPIIAPMLVVTSTRQPVPALDGVQALIATSAHGVRAMATLPDAKNLPLFCLSGASANAATELGLAPRICDGGGQQLADFVIKALSPKRGAIMWVRGAHFAFDMAAKLTTTGFEVHAWEAYTANAQHMLGDMAERALRTASIKAVLFHSARGAAVFADITAGLGVELRAIKAIAISEQAAKPIADAGFGLVCHAAQSTEEALMRCVQQHI